MAELNSTQAGTCQDLFGDSPISLDGNSDIAGIGVILSFLLSAYLPLAFIVLAYICGVVPIQLLSRADTDFFRVKYRRRSQWHKTLVKAILLFSDQQIVTGIAIMVAVYARLNTTSIYHFRIAMFLAWMSSNTHLTTLVVLRKYLLKNHVLRAWRLTGMVILYAMLLVAFVPGALWDWEAVTKGQAAPVFDPTQNRLLYLNPNLPARCLFEPPPSAGNAAIQAQINDTGSSFGWKCSIALVTALYLIKGSLLFDNMSNFIFYLFKALPCYFFERHLKRNAAAAHQHTLVRQQTAGSVMCRSAHLSRWARFKYRALVSTYILLVICLDYIETFIANLLLLAWGTIWGTVEILNSSFIFDQNDVQENYWGFGQILPVMMLLLPIASVFDSLFGGKHEKSSREHVHRAHAMEEGDTPVASASTSTSTLTTPSTSRSSSLASTNRSRLDRALPPLPALSERDFSQPPRYQAIAKYSGRTYSGFEEKIPLHDDYLEVLDSPDSDYLLPFASDPLKGVPTTGPNYPYGARSPLPRTDSNFEKYHMDQRQYTASKEALPVPSQFIFGRRAVSSGLDQPLSEIFRTTPLARPRLRDPTAAAVAECTRREFLQKYLYSTKWCQTIFVVNTLAQLAGIATLTIYGIFEKSNALASWTSVVTVVIVWMCCLALWWLFGMVAPARVYK